MGGLRTRRKIMISGREMATVLMIKAKVVPTGRPLSINASAIGIVPVTLEYRGIAAITARGTAKMLSVPAYVMNQSCGT